MPEVQNDRAARHNAPFPQAADFNASLIARQYKVGVLGLCLAIADEVSFADQIAGEEEVIMIEDSETGDRRTVEQFKAAR